MARRFKDLVKARLPLLVLLWRHAKHMSVARKSPQQVFTEIFRERTWGQTSSRSGPGSDLAQTEAVRRELPHLIQELECKSLLDIPCGDFYWMKSVEIDLEYTGGDIVKEMIESNRARYGGRGRAFVPLDLLDDELPRADLVLCRDCLVHFSYRHIFRALRNIKRSQSSYLLTTTFVERRRNEDIPTGLWRPINLEAPPFRFPPPVRLIDEECPSDSFQDKRLGLWQVDEIPDF